MIIILMGVSGSGKSTIGQRLANDFNWPFFDADDFHSLANLEKMKRGIPLTDADRIPWLWSLRQTIDRWDAAEKSFVLACSALKEQYRSILGCDRTHIRLIYLQGKFESIASRLQARSQHFMPATLLQSQFEALEEPQNALWMDIARSPEAIVQQIKSAVFICATQQ